MTEPEHRPRCHGHLAPAAALSMEDGEDERHAGPLGGEAPISLVCIRSDEDPTSAAWWRIVTAAQPSDSATSALRGGPNRCSVYRGTNQPRGVLGARRLDGRASLEASCG